MCKISLLIFLNTRVSKKYYPGQNYSARNIQLYSIYPEFHAKLENEYRLNC